MLYGFILTDHHGQASRIQQTTAFEPNRGLGFLLTLTGDQQPEYNYRLDQVSQILHRVSLAPLSPSDSNHML